MTQLVFFLEGPSEREMLKGLLPRLLPPLVYPRYVVFEGKQDLMKQLPKKLRNWQTPNSLFVVLRDQDSSDCREVKQKLTELCREAKRPNTLVRIACRELEAWYLGDLQAIEVAFEAKNLVPRQETRKFRNPDSLQNPVKELCLLAPAYQKISGSRCMGLHLSLQANRSKSFQVFVAGIRTLLGGTHENA